MPGKKSILDIFSTIKKEQDAEKPDLCVRLYNHVVRYAGNTNEAETSDTKIPNETAYAIKRLIQGLGSPRLPVKKCYFATLTTLLGNLRDNFEELTLESYKSVVDNRLSKYESKGEEGEVLVGQVLAYGAAIRSGLFFQSSHDLQKEILSQLLSKANDKSYLPLLTYTFVAHYMNTVDEETFKTVLWPILKAKILLKMSIQTFETLYTLLEVGRVFPSVLKKKLLVSTIETPSVLHTDTVSIVFKLLTGITWAPSLQHPVYSAVVRSILSSKNSHALLDSFWISNVDSVFDEHSPKLQQAAVLVIFNNVIEVAPLATVSSLLTAQFCQNLVNISSSYRSDISAKKAREVLQSIVKKCTDEKNTEESFSAVFEIFRILILDSGNILIDKEIGMKIINPLVAHLNEEYIIALGKRLKDSIYEEKSREYHWNFREKCYAVRLLARLTYHPKVQSLDWKTENLKFLLKNAFFKPNNSNVTINSELAVVMKNSFFSCLNHRFSNLDSLRTTLRSLIQMVDHLFRTSSENMRISLPEKVLERWQHTLNVAAEVEANVNKCPERQKILIVFHVLFLQMNLYLLSDADVADDALQELEKCYEKEQHTYKMRRKLEKRKLKHTVDEGSCSSSDEVSNLNWIEVIVELFLSLLSRETSFFRQLMSQLFPYLCPTLTPQATYQILQVLDPKTDDVLTRDGSDSEDVEEGDDSEIDSGVDNPEEVEAEEEHEAESDSEIEEEVDDAAASTLDKVRAAVHEALGIGGSVTDTESVDLDDVDEEEGRQLDKALSEAFKMVNRNHGKSKKQSAADKALTNFRIRVLDMVDIYVENNPSLSLMLDTLPTLFALLEFCIKDEHQKALETKVRGTLKKIGSLKKCSHVEEVKEELVAEVLKELMDKGVRTSSVFLDLSGHVADCCTFLVRIATRTESNSEKNKPKTTIFSVYQSALEDFFKKRECLLPISLFDNLFARIQWKENLNLCSAVVRYAFDSSVRGFRRNQALSLVISLYRNVPLLSSLPKDQLSIFEQGICIAVIKLLKDIQSGEVKVKDTFIAELFSVLYVMKSGKQGTGADWEQISSILGECSSVFSSLQNIVKRNYKKLCNLLRVSDSKRRDNEDNKNQHETINTEQIDKTEGQDEAHENTNLTVSKRKRKRKQNKNEEHVKSKKLRNETISEDLNVFHFTQVNDAEENI